MKKGVLLLAPMLLLVPMLVLVVGIGNASSERLDACRAPNSSVAESRGVLAALMRLRFRPDYPPLSEEQASNAITVADVSRQLAIPRRGLEIALATAIQESKLINLSGGDRDSGGFFQQRPSQGWGTREQITDPILATRAFYGRAEHTDNPGLLDIGGWQQLPLSQAAQAVQRSGYPSAYAQWESTAKIMAGLLTDGTAAASDDCPTRCPATASPAEEGLSPDALLVLRSIDVRFGTHTYGGVGDRAANPGSDHPTGRAVDVMIEAWDTADGNSHGNEVAEWVRAHAAELGATYIIWRKRIWSRGDAEWRPYRHPSGGSDPTLDHMDHVHVSVAGTRATMSCGANPDTVVYPIPAAFIGADRHNWRDAGSSWGAWHTGTDFSAPCGTTVYAAHAGTIEVDTTQGWSGPWLVKVTTGPRTLSTWYAHMQSLDVSRGQKVAAGDKIGSVGTEGNSTGCHLHFEVHLEDGPIYGSDNVDPSGWLKQNVARER